MPKNKVSDPITNQEMTFVHLVLSGTMTDRQAAEAAGLNPDIAACTKAKPRVQACMHALRAAAHERLVPQETEELRRFNQCRDGVLARLWQIADLTPEMTRGSASAQVKALSMIIAIEGLIPDRRAVFPQNKPAPLQRTRPSMSRNGCVTSRTSNPSTLNRPPPRKKSLQSHHPLPLLTPPQHPDRSSEGAQGPAVPAPLNPTQPASAMPRVPMADYIAPDTRRPFSIDRNRFGRRR